MQRSQPEETLFDLRYKDYTVGRLKSILKALDRPFQYSDRKEALFQNLLRYENTLSIQLWETFSRELKRCVKSQEKTVRQDERLLFLFQTARDEDFSDTEEKGNNQPEKKAKGSEQIVDHGGVRGHRRSARIKSSNSEKEPGQVEKNSVGKVEHHQCSICLEDFTHDQFPDSGITENCDHNAMKVCLPCLADHINAQVEDGQWAFMTCPVCPENLSSEDIRRLATHATFKRYETLNIRYTLHSDPNFHPCLRPGCDGGQIHLGESPRMSCKDCGFDICISHNLPWHAGQTCTEYDTTQRQKLLDEEASVILLAKEFKLCPGGCGTHYEKTGGCAYMFCSRCQIYFCWICLALLRVAALRTGHKPSCQYYAAGIPGHH